MLIAKNQFRKFVRKSYYIYSFNLKRCPKCGDSCNGKLKYYGNQSIICNKSNNHIWTIEPGKIIDLID